MIGNTGMVIISRNSVPNISVILSRHQNFSQKFQKNGSSIFTNVFLVNFLS